MSWLTDCYFIVSIMVTRFTVCITGNEVNLSKKSGEIDFGSSWREVLVSEGSGYRESTVVSHR